MGLNYGDLEKVPLLTYADAFKRIKDYYSAFLTKWVKMSSNEKTEHIFGNGRSIYNTTYVDESFKYVKSLPSIPTLAITKELAQNVISNSLEYSYHDEDRYGIKMGAYAHYIINNL